MKQQLTHTVNHFKKSAKHNREAKKTRLQNPLLEDDVPRWHLRGVVT
jgi:hypothetical protein